MSEKNDGLTETLILGATGFSVLGVFSGVVHKTAGIVEQATTEALPIIADIANIGVGSLAFCACAYVGIKGFKYLAPSKLIPIRISPAENGTVDIVKAWKMVEGMGNLRRGWLQGLQKGRIWVSWLVSKDQQGKIQFRCLVPNDVAEYTRQQIKLGFPGAMAEIEHDFKGLPFFKDGEGRAGHLQMAFNNQAYGLRNDVENNVGNILSMMPNGSIMEIRFSPTQIKELRNSGRGLISRIRGKDRTPEQTRKIKAITERYDGKSAFDVAITLFSKTNQIAPMAHQISQHTKGLNRLFLRQYKVFSKYRNPLNWNLIAPLPHRTMTWNDRELANLIMLPDANHPVMESIDIALEKRKPKANELNRGHKIGVADHPELLVKDDKGSIQFDKGRPIRVTTEVFTVHPIISGKSGSGKAAVIISILDEFLEKWVENPKTFPGFTLNDPHELTILLVINRLQELERKGKKIPWERVRCFRVGTGEYPMPMNLLHKTDGEQTDIDAMVKETLEIILEAFKGDLSKSQVYLENALQALLYDNESHIIAEIPRLFKKDKSGYLKQILSHLQNPLVYQWWMDEVVNADKKINTDAIVTRLNPFLSQKSMQRMYCQTQNVFDAQKIFDDGHIVLLSYKSSPPEAFKLTAGWLANNYHRTIQKRNPDDPNREHLLIFDESQEFHVPKFTKIVQQDRKFGLGLVTCTQDIHKLDSQLTEALKINSGMMISLNQSEGSKVMSGLMRNEFAPSHLSKLPKMHCAVWSDEGAANMVVPPPAFLENGEMVKWKDAKGNVTDHHKQVSREAREWFEELIKRECRHSSEVDAEIMERMTGKKERKVVEFPAVAEYAE